MLVLTRQREESVMVGARQVLAVELPRDGEAAAIGVAGRKGGEVVSRDRDHMSAIGREGGEARGRNNAIARANGSSDRESTMHVAREGMPPAVTRGPQRSTTRDERASLAAGLMSALPSFLALASAEQPKSQPKS